ncbi:MAG TPA: alpha/beta fold hydrolase [Methanoregulaceae archaeon]|nr:alpha/beta fold hydrolase [Methanoregulaceae archaeon]
MTRGRGARRTKRGNGRRGRTGRALRLAATAVVALVVIVFLVVPIGFAAYASLPHNRAVGPPPAGFANVSLVTDDGVPLAAWYAPSRNGAAIVLVHGATDSRENVRAHASLLRDSGFGVLALDLRGHGMSGGHGNTFGWEGTHDVQAAVAYLQGQDGVRAIGGLGLSLGGEVLLGALNATPALGAVVSEGATYRSTAEYLALPGLDDLPHSWMPRLIYAATGLFTGNAPPVPIVDSIAGAPDVRLLLIASGQEPNEVAYNTRFAAVAGSRAQVWVVPDVGHTGALAGHPDEYGQQVPNFFRSALLARGLSGS